MATIFALSSGRGAAGVAVIRVSGPDSGNAITGLTGREVPKAREAALRRLVNPGTGTVLDQAMVVWFPGPASFTGEDSAEFHVHGGRAVVAAVLEALGEQPGLRPAQPGEFTRRAVFNGKMDLTAAEGIADLVAAETEAQRRQALRQAGGELAAIYGAWREALLALRAEIEALIDFPDEDLPEGLEAQLRERLGKLRAAMGSHLAKANAGERVREGFHVAILGPPNVGKSSLINSLAKRGVAIVSDIPGTTRDVLEVHLDLDGLPVVVSDTAGIRETQEAIEMEGVARARARAESADFRVVLCDSLAWPALPA
ncbi:MAG: tRNA uridine-5-carboxymethylaminomethyl(34) synthesis GTPase MnmE, partial [Alphaproteobacteria bacterium]|nr:tRNA uridine-5-carboxymethylaminomethyl(34) synthesis GTPase MnmE [Alphaproteobacteria bacterium]